MSSVIVLAAGEGHRFGGECHKALSPLLWGEGTLQRLLRQLRSLHAAHDVRVVTGRHGREVSLAARGILPDVLCPAVSADYRPSLLRSVLTGVAVAPLKSPSAGAWVLFADTVYHPSTLADLLARPTTTLMIASVPAAGITDHPIGLKCGREDPSRLREIGPDVDPRDGVMAPAVYWTAESLHMLPSMLDRGLATQWQAIRERLEHEPVRLIACARATIQDIDTKADLSRVRQEIVGRDAIRHFRQEISKDERTLTCTDEVVDGRFIKQCVSAPLADLEHEVLRWLGENEGDGFVPRVEHQTGRRLAMTHVKGIRFFDLLRLLRDLGEVDPALRARAEQMASLLLERAVRRLVKIQKALSRWSAHRALVPYPFESKVSRLLAVMSGALALPDMTREEAQELKRFGEVWRRQDARVPFRDATPKNMIIQIPSLDLRVGQATEARLALLAGCLDRDGTAQASLPAGIRMVDYDFTSVEHLTAPEDDFISLLGHQGSLDAGRRFLGLQGSQAGDWADAVSVWTGQADQEFVPDRGRFARALMVRYLRFGGRKLLYRMINPTGFSVRFRHDHPAFYLGQLPALLEEIDPAFKTTWPAIHQRLSLLAQVTRDLPQWSTLELHSDLYLDLVGQPVRYWQESPVEGLGATAGATAVAGALP